MMSGGLVLIELDQLTGVLCKESFYKNAQDILKSTFPADFEILRLNIEKFNIINEIFGEDVGDRLLQAIGKTLQNLAIPSSVSGRLYTDNFVVLYPADEKYRNLILAILKELSVNFLSHYIIQIAYGIYHITDLDLSISRMCDRANLALKSAKGNYLIEYGIYNDELRNKILQEQHIISQMETALKERQFLIWLQPKYNTTNEKIIGSEALVRWCQPDKGLVYPNDFIPIFEQNGFITKLDRYVWEEACRLLAKWRDSGKDILPISINISRIDIYSPDLVEFIAGLVKKYDLKPEWLQLEITESAYTDNAQQIIDVSYKLRQAGFTLLMDDFGSGYSSLNMLNDLPVDILKLDLHFLKSDGQNGRSSNILNSIVRMAQWLDLGIIAEGVEKKEEVDFLRNIGCNVVQGYYYSKPVPVDEYEKMMVPAQKNKELS